MSASDKINKIFRLDYAQAVKDKIGADGGSASAFFLGSEAQKGPVGGDGIPNEYTNQGIHNIASDDLFFDPGHSRGYNDALQRSNDQGAKPGPVESQNLYNAREDL
ncbi:uncharacterized protein ColSpa_11238 [Colletotrichum spaethianum]|uniref:Uncharacterized protein n=1 Tax=Colletotrichum spaethianum TaxID=700344 RepID=A0AA37PF69_9PEZI|nr:uncharacterized protein ColSpa_11238 [Colletotrichum spaethianum]GKT51057.1 hypothetical protein ColSpa_11238 [Colletotrichum spaethianum]